MTAKVETYFRWWHDSDMADLGEDVRFRGLKRTS
jgi:hypothetical protein